MKKKKDICVVIFSIQFSRQLSYQSVLGAFSPSIFSLIAVEINLKKWMSDLAVTPTVTQPYNPVTFEI